MKRTREGREVTAKAYKHLGKTDPGHTASGSLFL